MSKEAEKTIIQCKECGVEYEIGSSLDDVWCPECQDWIQKKTLYGDIEKLRGDILDVVYDDPVISKSEITDKLHENYSPSEVQQVTGEPVTNERENLKELAKRMLFRMERDGDIILVSKKMLDKPFSYYKEGYKGKYYEDTEARRSAYEIGLIMVISALTGAMIVMSVLAFTL